MDVINPPTTVGSRQPAAAERLDSWKEIAAYLKRDESTVRRWETEGLPVRRRPHLKGWTVYAYKVELDAWWNDGHARSEEIARQKQLKEKGAQVLTPSARRLRSRLTVVSIVLIAALIAVIGTAVWFRSTFRDRVIATPATNPVR